MNWNNFAKDVHRVSVDHGWWDNPPTFAEIIVMCHSELSEAIEEYRDRQPMVYCEKWTNLNPGAACLEEPCGGMECLRNFPDRKPEGVAVELGDCILRMEEEIVVHLIEDEGVREETPTVGYYAMFEYIGGTFRKTMYWTKEKMLRHADRYSPAFSAEDYQKLQEGKIPKSEAWKYSSFWYKSFDDMAIKTMLRQILSRWGIMSIDLQRAFEADENAVNANLTPDYLEGADDPAPGLASPENNGSTAPTEDGGAGETKMEAKPDELPEDAF